MQDEAGNPTQGLGQVIIAKHRNGAVCDVNLHFRAEFARFEEWDSIGLVQGLAPMDDNGNMVQSFESSINSGVSAMPQSNIPPSEMDAPF
jgi:replicative DNA helicase